MILTVWYTPIFLHDLSFNLANLFTFFFICSQVFVGLGDPFEGPAALEALANGCYFINPKVDQEPINMSVYLSWRSSAIFSNRPAYWNSPCLLYFCTMRSIHLLPSSPNQCFFIFIKFNPAFDRLNHGFFAGKPMDRKVRTPRWITKKKRNSSRILLAPPLAT